MVHRARWLLGAGAVLCLVAPGRLTQAGSEIRDTTGHWWSETVNHVHHDERTIAIPSDAPPVVTVICDTWSDNSYSFQAQPGQQVSCTNGATPHWTK